MKRVNTVLPLIRLMLLLSIFTSPVVAQDNNLTYDHPVRGELSADSLKVIYTFSGHTGDVIAVSMTRLDDTLDPFLELHSPSGQTLTTNDNSLAGNLDALLGPYKLEETGLYSVIATRHCLSCVGRFEVMLKQAQLTPLIAGEAATVELSADHPAYLSFSNPQSHAVFRLTGQVLRGAGYLNLVIQNPWGESFAESWEQHVTPVTVEPLFLALDGSYLISASLGSGESPSKSESIQATIRLETIEAQAIALGRTVSAMLDDTHSVDYYTFKANEGDWLRLSSPPLKTGEQAFEAIILAPDGTYLRGLTLADQYNTVGQVLDPVRIPTSGEYLLLVRRVDMSGTGQLHPVRYNLTLDQSQAQLLKEGQPVEAIVGGGTSENTYRYDGAGGETIRVTLQSISSNYTPGAWLEGPPPSIEGYTPGTNPLQYTVMGTTVGTATYEVTLPVTGAYLLRVSNAFEAEHGPTAGTYKLLIETIHEG